MATKQRKLNAQILIDEEMGEHLPRPTQQENFNSRCVFAADTPGAPRLPETKVIDKYRMIIYYNSLEYILKDIEMVKKRGGVVCIQEYAFTNFRLLEKLAGVNVMAVIQKIKPNVPLTEKYNELTCSIRRYDFPGDVIPRLTRRDAQQDFGIIDSVRYVGNDYGTSRLLQYETRSYAHPKIIVMLVPDKNGKLCYYCAYYGSYNLSHSAEFSIEDMTRTTDPNDIEGRYMRFAHSWSYSEGLFSLSTGIDVTYFCEDKPVKYPTPPICPACRSVLFGSKWFKSIDRPGDCERFLVCTACKSRSKNVFLKEHMPRQR
jgi:hypothetical protein